MLIGSEDRERNIRLLYRDEQFSIPGNVHIIATMSAESAECSITDYSLRRRFAFYEVPPAYGNKAFSEYIRNLSNKKLEKLVKIISDINKAVFEDPSLSDNIMIGHGYFCGFEEIDDTRLSAIARYELIPLIRRIFSDQPEQIRHWAGKVTATIGL